jgi:membrane-associated protease RseP (regulator of RpoE activity)
VASVVPNSPAAKAGLKPHDILLRANDTELREMQNLVDLVVTQGEKNEKISLEILRKGKQETVTLTPEERPADAPRPDLGSSDALGGGFGGIIGPEGLPQELLQQFQTRTPFEFRNFGPGVIVGGGQGLGNMPNGVSVNITKEKGKPTHITVKRGEETWEVVGDDPESLEQLPEDLRPFVEQMLHGASPMDLHTGQGGRGQMPEIGDGRLRERMERMEQRMQELMERLNENNRSTQEPSTDENQSK